MTRWQSLGKLTIPAILLAILYHRPGNWAFEPTGRADCSCSFREMSFHELTVELSAFDASLRMRGAIARGLSANQKLAKSGARNPIPCPTTGDLSFLSVRSSADYYTLLDCLRHRHHRHHIGHTDTSKRRISRC